MKKRDKKQNEKFPGYPHYPDSEDITRQEDRLDADVDNLSQSRSAKNSNLKEQPPSKNEKEKNPETSSGTSSDLTTEDFKTLGKINKEEEDETLLPLLELGPDFSGDDLDVPGSELDDESEDIGSEDEENNYYSNGQN